MEILFILIVIALMFTLARIAGRRFEREQRREGRWDEKGPLVETEAPPSNYWGAGMEERREVIGEWHGRITKDRRPQHGHHDYPEDPDEQIPR